MATNIKRHNLHGDLVGRLLLLSMMMAWVMCISRSSSRLGVERWCLWLRSRWLCHVFTLSANVTRELMPAMISSHTTESLRQKSNWCSIWDGWWNMMGLLDEMGAGDGHSVSVSHAAFVP